MQKPVLFPKRLVITKFTARTAARSRSFLPVFVTELFYMLLAANQDSGCITCFRRDEKTGLLKQETAEISCPAPVCIVAHPV
ncbi:beta-propeller fold lactonase family protein [Gemmiger formicilis]|uniref:beta-propeller fold lactonase family protein n=1 Tax=Gemmiger formicilis TaxID=745368 RepID=UPI003FD77EF3